jgi:hypothetical protein
MSRACSMHESDEKCIQNFSWKTQREEQHLEVFGRIMLLWILKRWGGMMWSGFIWLRIGTSQHDDKHLCVIKVVHFLSSWLTANCSRRTVFHGVGWLVDWLAKMASYFKMLVLFCNICWICCEPDITIHFIHCSFLVLEFLISTHFLFVLNW